MGTFPQSQRRPSHPLSSKRAHGGSDGLRAGSKTVFTHGSDKETADGTVKKTKVRAGDEAACWQSPRVWKEEPERSEGLTG